MRVDKALICKAAHSLPSLTGSPTKGYSIYFHFSFCSVISKNSCTIGINYKQYPLTKMSHVHIHTTIMSVIVMLYLWDTRDHIGYGVYSSKDSTTLNFDVM